jgi:hypothetical protein
MARRRYSDDERAAALAALDAHEGDVAKTARAVGVPRKTLEEWAKGRHHPDVADLRQEKKTELADQLERLAYTLAAAAYGKIDPASLQQVLTSLGIAVDKMRLLREQPTSIAGGEGLTDEDRITRLNALAERVHARQAGGAHANGTGGV